MNIFNMISKASLFIAFCFIFSSLSAQSNQYLHFDGEDDYVVLDNGSKFFSGTNKLTLTGWFYTEEQRYGQGYIGFRHGSGTAEFYLIQLNDGVMECRINTSTMFSQFVTPANTALPQTWQHFAWVFDVNKVSLYVNGVLKGSASAGGIFLGDDTPFGVGKSLLGGFNFVFHGGIDEVSVWKKALTVDEIKDIMEHEIDPNAEGLGIYYKFNQGLPNEDNKSITHLKSEVFPGERDGQLVNFELDGSNSNFVGELQQGFQAISIDQIGDKLTTDLPFRVNATASSGLPVELSIVSGPANLSGDTIVLTGEAGKVEVKASQPGNADWDPASDVTVSFDVFDPQNFEPTVELHHPLAGDVSMPSLTAIDLAAVADYGNNNSLFNITKLWFEVDGEQVDAVDYGNGHYTAWWTPTSYGIKNIAIKSTNNYGATFTVNTEVNLIPEISDKSVTAVEGLWLNSGKNEGVVSATLPSFMGAYNKVTATLEVKCPTGGCGPWDRESYIEVKGPDGKWYQIIHYITPYAKECAHTIDLTDYISLLKGMVELKYVNQTLDNGYLYNLKFNYTAGEPDFVYTLVTKIWDGRYPFGDLANLQPVPIVNKRFADNSIRAKLKLISPGHGWGDNNTSNAAEFYEATHNILVNGAETFTQHNWEKCNPNPDGCQPQNGTWYYDRAGWCPGSIVKWFDFDMTDFITTRDVTLQYKFYDKYIDYCSPNNPDCIPGTTCPDCNDTFYPVLVVNGNIIEYAHSPISLKNNPTEAAQNDFIISPNPARDIINISSLSQVFPQSSIALFSATGQKVINKSWDGYSGNLNVSQLTPGIYILAIVTQGRTYTHKVIIE